VTEAGVKHPRHKALLDGTPYRGRSVTKAKAPVAPKKAAPEKTAEKAEKADLPAQAGKSKAKVKKAAKK